MDCTKTTANAAPTTTMTATKLRIKVRGPQGDTKVIDLESDSQISTLKEEIATLTNIPPENQRWIMNGIDVIKSKNDDTTLGFIFNGNAAIDVGNSAESSAQTSAGGETKTRSTINTKVYKSTQTIDTTIQQGDKFGRESTRTGIGQLSKTYEDNRFKGSVVHQGDTFE